MSQIQTNEFEKLAKILYLKTGISLNDSDKNRALIQNRISSLMRSLKLRSPTELILALEGQQKSVEQNFISAMTTNKTEFFREFLHYEFLVQDLLNKKPTGTELRLWSAACSIGAEPYSLAMALLQIHDKIQMRPFSILGTDIDQQVLQRASLGVYRESEMEGVAPHQRNMFFDKISKDKKVHYQVKSQVSASVRFAPFNLVHEPLTFRKQFHYIFIRNVLIYFDQKTIDGVIDRLTRCLEPGGILISGLSESAVVRHHDLKPLRDSIFRKEPK